MVCNSLVGLGGLYLSPCLRGIDCTAVGPGDNLGRICDDCNNFLSAFGGSPEVTGRSQVFRSHNGWIPQTQICADAT